MRMRLAPGCPRCPATITTGASTWRCPTHGEVVPLWRAVEPTYAAFADYLALARPFPTWLPWPMPPDWRVNDFGVVAVPEQKPAAAFLSFLGPTDLDGLVQMTVVTEEPGVGLAARCGGATYTDPGTEVGDGPPLARVRLEAMTVPVWPVTVSDGESALDRLVLAGEAGGRWLWLVLRPATAVLLLNDLGALVDAATLGPQLVSLPFAENRPNR
jgi:Family of unknown function (DUF6758)